MLREDLASDFAGTILDSVKENGLLRTISEDVGINRSEFNRKGIAGMKLFRVLRILVGLAFYMEPDRWMKCWRLLGDYNFETARLWNGLPRCSTHPEGTHS